MRGHSVIFALRRGSSRCVLESTLPMRGALSSLSTEAFSARAARYRIGSYHNLGRDPERCRSWISNHGPVLVRVVADQTWDRAAAANGKLERFRPDTARGVQQSFLTHASVTHPACLLA